MTAAARFWDAHRKSGGVSVLVFASMFTPTLPRQLLSGTGPRAGGVGARPCSWSTVGRRSRRSAFPSRGSPCIGTSCVGCRSQVLTSAPSSWHRRPSSSSSRAHRRASAPQWRGAGSGSELLDERPRRRCTPA
jgi:hypothetical protein